MSQYDSEPTDWNPGDKVSWVELEGTRRSRMMMGRLMALMPMPELPGVSDTLGIDAGTWLVQDAETFAVYAIPGVHLTRITKP